MRKSKKRFWDFYARIYDLLRTFGPYMKMQRKAIEYLQLIPSLTVLDASCGTGNTLEEINKFPNKPWGISLFGLDCSSAMLARAGRKLGDSAKLFPPGDYNNIPGNGKYDRIISINSLYASHDPEATLRHWYDRLEDGGLLVVANPFSSRQGPVWREYFRDMRDNIDIIGFFQFIIRSPFWLLFISLNQYLSRQAKQGNLHFLPPDDLRIALSSIGFKIIQSELVYAGGSLLISAQKDEDNLVRRAQTREEIASVFRLRYNIYCAETRMVDPAMCRGNQEIDQFDAFATHFIARSKGEVIGCVRYFPDVGKGFLLEEYFFLPPEINYPETRKITIEISRASLLPERRGGPLFFLLMEKAIKHGLERGYSLFIGASTKKIWNDFRSKGWKVKRWTDYDKSYHNTCSAPAMFCPPFKNFGGDEFNQLYISSPGFSIFYKYFSWCSSF